MMSIFGLRCANAIMLVPILMSDATGAIERIRVTQILFRLLVNGGETHLKTISDNAIKLNGKEIVLLNGKHASGIFIFRLYPADFSHALLSFY
jgi:hypothetical protein